MHDPNTQICSFPSYRFQEWMRSKWWIPRFITHWTLFTLWHKDPCKGPGGDDSCGWFKRAHHGDKKVLEKIIKDFEFDWDRVFKSDSGKIYHCGYFYPVEDGAGMPNMSVTAIVLNLFLIAASVHFKSDGRSNWKKARKFVRRNLFDIMLFAENPTDSLRDSIIQKFGTERNREERIRNMAAVIYGWILRKELPWYRHARWHIHHWRFQFHFLQTLKRGFIDRCAICGKGFKFRESVCGDWSGKRIWHDRCSDQGRTPSK